MGSIERVKNWKTTVIGVIVLGLGIWRYAAGLIDTGAFISLMLLAYTFILAKNSLLEGITMGYYKIKEASKPPAEEPTEKNEA